MQYFTIKSSHFTLLHTNYDKECHPCHFFLVSLPQSNNNMVKKDINRLKVVLVENKRTNKWLAEQLGKDPGTVSKWCTNTLQPNLETLDQIATVLNINIRELLWPTHENYNH